MTYDGHAYCFPDLRADGGFADPEQFRRHLQLAIATHFQPAWRKKDRAPADSSGLADPSAGWSFEALKEADFRPAGYGRFEWTVGGDDYVKQYMPPSVAGTSYPAQALVAEMGHAGVDLALLHRIPYLGVSNEFIADCVRLFPDRLRGLAYVEEWRVRPDTDWAIKKLERAVDQLGLVGLQFLPDHLSLYGQSEEWDVREFKPYWDALASLSIPLFITPSYSSLATGESALEGFLRQLRTIRGWMETYPEVDVVLTHGLSWRMFIDGQTVVLPDKVFDAAPIDNPRFHIQVMFPISLGGIWEYPMPQVRPVMETLVDRVGADRLIWGTDMPIVMRFYTYRQCLKHMRVCGSSLRPEELDMILGGNMVRLIEASNPGGRVSA